MGKKKKILIVEDDKLLLELLCDRMKKEGFQLYKAKEGASALKKALKNRPDLILLDIMMPGMDGLTMLNKLRRNKKWGSKVPVVLLSNFSDPHKLAQAKEYKASDYLLKAESKMADIIRKVREKTR